MDYSVKGLSKLAGVSVRTLHHYDSIGLLHPETRTAAGYRVYGEAELLRLQQILFYRELDVPLDEIRALLDKPGFDPTAALEGHRKLLAERARRIGRLMETVDRTIDKLRGETMLSDQELYEGFGKEEIETMKRRSAEAWGDTAAYAQSQDRMRSMTRDKWATVKAEGAALDEALAAAMKEGLAPDSPRVEALMRRKADHLRYFYDPSAELFAGLGRHYCEQPEFRQRYEDLAPGLPEFLRDAMAAFASKYPDLK